MLATDALEGLVDPPASRLQLDPAPEQLLVEAFPGQQLGDAELTPGGRKHPVDVESVPGRNGELGMPQAGLVVPTDALLAGEHRVRSGDDVGRALRLVERPLLVGDGLAVRHRVHLRADPAEPHEHARTVRSRRATSRRGAEATEPHGRGSLLPPSTDRRL